MAYGLPCSILAINASISNSSTDWSSFNDSNQQNATILCSTMNVEDQFQTFDYLVILPTIILFGLTGNLISLVTIYTTPLRHSPANQYLIVLCISDTVFLSTLILTLFKVDHLSFYMCLIIEYILFVAAYTSTWTITALTVERFLAIFYPLSRLNYGDMDRTRLIIGRMLPCPLILGLSVFVYLGYYNDPADQHYPDIRQCAPKRSLQLPFEIADLALSYIIPCLVVVILNIMIARRLRVVALNEINFGQEEKRALLKKNQLEPTKKKVEASMSMRGSGQSTCSSVASRKSTGFNDVMETTGWRTIAEEQTIHQFCIGAVICQTDDCDDIGQSSKSADRVRRGQATQFIQFH